MGRRIQKSVVFTGYRCNNRCIFCMEANKRSRGNRTTAEIKKEIFDARERGNDYLELIGGEMTIRDDFIELVKFADHLDFSTIMISTNGRMFSYKNYAERILEAGITSIVFSIHGHNAELHDSLTQVPGSFEQLMEGVENLMALTSRGYNVEVGSNTTIVEPNYKFLPQLGSLIKDLGIRNSEFIFVDCNEGGALDDFGSLVPKVSKTASYIHDCLDIGEDFPHWDVRYVPLCYFQEYLDQISELKEVQIFDTEHLGAEFRDYHYEKSRKEKTRIKPEESCRGCALYQICEGVWNQYYRHYGAKELEPVSSKCSLSGSK